jgi:hypothetical protein
VLVDPAQHVEVERAGGADSVTHRRLKAALAAVQREVLLTTPIRTLVAYDRAERRARVMVTSEDAERPGEWYALAPDLIDPIAWSLEDGVARYTGAYRNAKGTWISAVAPIVDPQGRAVAVLSVDYQVDVFLDRLHELDATIVQGSAAGAVCALLLGLVFARRLTRPISALTGAVARVADGDRNRCRCGPATRWGCSRARSTGWSRACGNVISSAAPSADTCHRRSPRRCWSLRTGCDSAVTSARSRCSCPTCAATRASPSMATRPA